MTCSTTALVQGSYLGPSLMATVASEHACAPGAALAEASIWRWRLAREGGVPKAGPPHVMAGVMPVLAKIVALLFIFVMYLARAVRPLAAARRLLACVAMRLLPELTGVPRSVTGEFAFTAVPLAVMRLAAWQARALSLALITVFVALCVRCFRCSSVRISWKQSTNSLHAFWAVVSTIRNTKSST